MAAIDSSDVVCPPPGDPDETRAKEALGVFGDIWLELTKAVSEQQDHI